LRAGRATSAACSVPMFPGAELGIGRVVFIGEAERGEPNMPREQSFSCVLIGNQTRLVQCGEVLLNRGHRILGVISSDPMVQSWCREKNLALSPQDGTVLEVMRRQPFDYLFSIDNFALLPKEVLSMPGKMGINFHDGPLPRYAGSNATNWALIRGEMSHGVSWHVMTEKADAGDILQQETFPIAGNETAFTLNAKCFEASIQSFSVLVDRLAQGKADPKPQDLSRRTFCPLWKRPYAAATIDWGQPAENIYNLYRGLEFNNYPNPLGLPKLYLGNTAVAVRKIDILDTPAQAEPGTVLRVTDTSLEVSTATNVLTLSGLTGFDGARITPQALLEAASIPEGGKLPTLEKEHADRIDKVYRLLCRQESYWAKRLAELEPMEIPYAKKHDLPGGSLTGSAMRMPLPAMRKRPEKSQDTPGDEILSAFVAYLYRIGGKESFDIGFSDGSLQECIRGCENFFFPFVPLRAEVNAELTFDEFHVSLRKQISATMDRKTYVRDLKLRYPHLRELSRHRVSAELPVVVFRVDQLPDPGETRLNAELAVFIPNDGRECLWVYDEKALDPVAVGRMQEQLTEILKAVNSGGDLTVGMLSVIPEQEKRKILSEWNSTFVPYPTDVCLHQLFEAQAERTPDAPALAFEGDELTYREFNVRANQLAHYLRVLGVGVESLVGVYMERSFEMVISLYAIQKAGGAYVPLDPEYPKERIGFMLEDARAPVILTQQHLAANIPENQARVVCVDSSWPEISRESRTNPESGAGPKNAAYVIFTSGSTGRPKGVLNEHRGIVNRLLWMQDEYGLTPQDSVLQKTTFSFDVSVWEFFWPLLVGARLVVARPGGHRDSGYLVRTINEQKITTIHFVPSMLQLFLEDRDVGSCKSLKRVICSGEALPYELQERFFQSLGCELHNLYGPTEAAVDVTYWPCRRDSEMLSVPIGRPVANTQIYILDKRMQPVPVSVPGELHIGGIQVARGYVNRPDLTAEKFIADPFSPDPEARLYKTGDLCKFLPDGAIDYLGRLDFQVKIRGLRIEIGEIESVLGRHPAIREVVVVAREDAPGDKRLVAYVVAKGPSGINVEELRAFLKGKLADYMVPSAFVQMEAFPLTSSGKADRKALPAPAGGRQVDTDYVAPQSDAEKTIGEIWKEFLKLEAVGTHDNFFDLGGHSLLLVRVMNRLKPLFGRPLTVVDMFQRPTIHELAKFLTEDPKTTPSSDSLQERVNRQKEALRRQKKGRPIERITS